MEKQKRKVHFAWWVLVGLAIVVGIARGGINSAGGLFLAPVSKDLDIGMGQLTLYLSIASIVTMLFLPLAGKMIAKYDIRLVLITSIVLQAGSFALFGLMNSVWGWYLLAIPMSFGAIFVTQMAGPVLINQWFKKHNGLALGLMMAAVGLFGAIIQPAVGNLIETQGWRTAYLTVGIVAIIVIIPVILLLIRKSPQHKGLLPYGMEKTESEEGKADAHPLENKGVTAAVARKSVAFYALFLFLFFITAVASFSQHIAPYAESIGYSTSFAGNVMGAFMGGMLVGALAFGFLTDKMGAQNTTIFAMIAGLVSIGLLIFVPENTIVFAVAIGLFGFVSASIGTLGPLLTSSIFGNKEYSQIYATAAIGLAVAGIVALPGYGFVYDIFGSYDYVLYTVAFMIIINIVLVNVAFKGKKTLEDAGHWN